MWPPSFKRPTRNVPAAVVVATTTTRESGGMQQSPQQAIRVSHPHRVRGRGAGADVVFKAKPGRPGVPKCLRQSPAHVSATPLHTGGMTLSLMCAAIKAGLDLWCEGRLCEAACLLSACEVVAKVKTSLFWWRVSSSWWGQGWVPSHSLPELSPLPLWSW